MASAIFSSGAEIFQMHRLDGGDDRHMRAHQLGERRDLAGMVHADLEHGIFRVRRAARERQRHAPVIVVGGGRGMRFAVGASASRSASLVPVLPTEPVTAMTFADVRARAARARSRKASSTSVDDQQRGSAGKCARLRARHHGEAGARFQRGVDEVVAVAVVALDGEEGLALGDAAAVDGKARNARPAARRISPRASRRPCRRGSTARSCHLALQGRGDRVVIGERQHACRRRSGRSRGPCRRSAARRRC